MPYRQTFRLNRWPLRGGAAKRLMRCGLTALALLWGTMGAQAQSPLPQTLLWKLEKPSADPKSNPEPTGGYLYGTIHLTEASVYRFADQVPAALASVKAFAMELVPDADLQMRMVQAMMLPGDTTLRQLLPDSTYLRLDSLVQAMLNMPLETFDRFKPVFLSFLFMQKDIVVDPSRPFLDMFLSKWAIGLGKHVVALETPEEQIAALTGQPTGEQVKTLVQMVNDYRAGDEHKGADELQKMVAVYVAQDLEGMIALGDSSDYMTDGMEERLLTLRNQVMAHRLDSLIGVYGQVFAAVGSLHLPGPGGLIDLMLHMGYNVTPVLPTFNRLEAANSPAEWPYMAFQAPYAARFPAREVPASNGTVTVKKKKGPYTHYRWQEVSIGREYNLIMGVAQSKKSASALIQPLLKQVAGYDLSSNGGYEQTFAVNLYPADSKVSGYLQNDGKSYYAVGMYLLPSGKNQFIPAVLMARMDATFATEAAKGAMVEFVKRMEVLKGPAPQN